MDSVERHIDPGPLSPNAAEASTPPRATLPDPGLSREAVAALLPPSSRPALPKGDAIRAIRHRWPTMDGILARRLLDDQVRNGWAVWVEVAPALGASNPFPEGIRRTRDGDRLVRETPRPTQAQLRVLRVLADGALHEPDRKSVV